MFGIQRYFSIATALVVLLAMVVVGVFFRTNAIRDLVDLTGANNVALASSLSSTLIPRFPTLLDSSVVGPMSEPLNRDQVAQLNAAFGDLAKGARLLKAKVYRPNGFTVYSSDNDEIATNRLDEENPQAFQAAVREREPKSGHSIEERLSAFSGEVFDRDVVETYFPILDDGGELLGVLELYTDIAPLTESIDRRTILAIALLCAVFVMLYVVLVFVVMRRVMAPIHFASKQAAAICPQESGIRLSTENMPVELLPMITAINQALDRLDSALTAHRQFTADAAHELLTPLAVLKANVETVANPSKRRVVLQDVDSITEIVSQLLELAELDSLDPLQAEEVDLSSVCVDVVSAIAPIAIREDKAVELTGSQHRVSVRCCSKLLGRALRNLVENGLAHTPEGTTVRVDLQEDGAIRVVDKGPGVPIEERDRIFRRFWRGKSRKGPGAGLGLSIVRRFAETFGGSIEIADAPGGGAEFVLRLPVSKAT